MKCLACQQPVKPGQKCIPVKELLTEIEYEAGYRAVVQAIHLHCLAFNIPATS